MERNVRVILKDDQEHLFEDAEGDMDIDARILSASSLLTRYDSPLEATHPALPRHTSSYRLSLSRSSESVTL
jgi:hypothetical protein